MNFDFLIFDCDGTLVDTEPLQNLACAQLLSEQGLMQFTPEVVAQRFTGTRFSDMLRVISAETGHVFPESLREAYVARAAELSKTHFKKIEGAVELVSTAKERCKIAVVSNGQRATVFHSLELAGLRKFFPDDHVFTGLMANAKPAPDLFLLAAEKLGAAPAHSVVIEDSVPGVTGGVAAGMKVIGFTGAHGSDAAYGRRLEIAGAGTVFSSLIHIKQALFD